MMDRGALRQAGFGLLDLLVVLVVVALAATLAVPAYYGRVERARVSKAAADISTISVQIDGFRVGNHASLPQTLAELEFDLPPDPWGRPYRYLNIVNSGGGAGDPRTHGKRTLLNTDFDLYSVGKDGRSTDSLSAPASRDDIVRANNGAFVGLGEDY